MKKYTNEDWQNDHNFNAQPGQEIEESIYWEMYEVMPPLSLPRRTETAGYSDGFMVSEPYDTDETGQLRYSAFGKHHDKFYFIGYFTTQNKTPYTEILKLRKMLKQAGIPHKFKDNSVRCVSESENTLELTIYQILYPDENKRVISVVEGNGTYGGGADKLEIMGLLTPKEEKEDSVLGGLTAEEVFKRIEKHYKEKVCLK